VPALALADRTVRDQVHATLMTEPTARRTVGIMHLRGHALSATASEFYRVLVSTMRKKTIEQIPGIKVVTTGSQTPLAR
jgi:hypothetical protein